VAILEYSFSPNDGARKSSKTSKVAEPTATLARIANPSCQADPFAPKTLFEHPQVLIFAKRQRSEIIENLQGGRADCHLGQNRQPLVSG